MKTLLYLRDYAAAAPHADRRQRRIDRRVNRAANLRVKWFGLGAACVLAVVLSWWAAGVFP